MPSRWTIKEEKNKKKELVTLYVKENKTIFETGKILGIKYQTVYDRLKRLGIPTCPERKPKFRNFRTDIKIPNKYSGKLAEFVGILLGDGHISNTQIVIYINSLETPYIKYIEKLFKKLFGAASHKSHALSKRVREYHVTDIRLGSTELVRYFLKMGLVRNKTKSQIDIPAWINIKQKYQLAFLRGFFDTDGSVYKLKFGTQICYKNASIPLLKSTQKILTDFDYHPSQISYRSLYLTRKKDLRRFFKEVGPANQKHLNRAKLFKVI